SNLSWNKDNFFVVNNLFRILSFEHRHLPTSAGSTATKASTTESAKSATGTSATPRGTAAPPGRPTTPPGTSATAGKNNISPVESPARAGTTASSAFAVNDDKKNDDK